MAVVLWSLREWKAIGYREGSGDPQGYQYIVRRTKEQPGNQEPGVGKTAVAEGLASVF